MKTTQTDPRSVSSVLAVCLFITAGAALASHLHFAWVMASKDGSPLFVAEARSHFQFLAVLIAILAVFAAGILWSLHRARINQQRHDAELERLLAVQHYEYLVRYANDIVLMMDGRGRIIEANKRAVESYGYSREELLQLTVRELQDPATLTESEAQWRAVGDGVLFETRHRRKSGSTFPVEVSAKTVEVEGRQCRQSIIRDITKRKQAEEALRISEKRFRDVVEGAPVAIFVSCQGRIQHVNKTALELFGAASEDELLGASIMERVHPDFRAIVRERIKQVEGQRTVCPALEEKYLRLDGTAIDVEVSAVPYTYQGQEGGVVFFQNISERKQAEEKLRASEERYRLIADNTSDVIWTLDAASLRITYVSPSVLWLRGYSPEEVLAQSLEEMMTPESYQRAVTLLAERTAAFESGDKSARTAAIELQNTCRDGSIATTETVATLLSDELGHVTGVVGVSRDITERNRVEEALRESEEKFRALFVNGPDALYLATLEEGRIIDINDAFEALFEYSREEVIGKTSLQLDLYFDPADRATVVAQLKATGRVRSIEVRGRKKGGGVVFVLLSIMTMMVRGEAHIVGAIRDIAHRKRSENALRESVETIARQLGELETIYAGAPVGLCVLDSDLRILRLNERLAEINGLSVAEHLGRTVSEVLPQLSPQLEPLYRCIFEMGKPVVGVEIRGTTPAQPGVERDWLASYYPIKEGARVVGINAVVQEITDLKRAQEALLESEQRYRELFENSQLGIYRTTPDGRIVLANPALLSMLGYSSLGELADRNLEHAGFEPQYDRSEFKSALEGKGALRNLEAGWRRRDGGIVYVRENARAVRDSNGAVLYYDGTVEDITERKRIADALRASEERFRQVAEDAGVFVWEVDANGLYTYASPVVETILGYTPDELIGKLHYYDLFAPDGRGKVKAITTEAFAQRRSLSSFLNANLRKDGTSVILETSGTPSLDASGNLLGYRGTGRDVTGRAQATEELLRHRDHLEELVRERTAELEEKNSKLADEVLRRTFAVEAFRQSEARLQLQFGCMPVACITIGSDSRIRSWNPAAERIFGYSTIEAVGAPAVDLVVPEDLRSELGPLLQGLFETTETSHKVNDNVTKDGRRITCEWTNTRLLDLDGSVQGVLCMVQDITSRKQAEEALKRKAEELVAFNKAMIGREKRVIELKEEVNRFCLQLKQPPAYPPVWKRDDA